MKSTPYTRAVPFSRPPGRRRIEVFSPKIGRRLSLGGYDVYRTWLVIEANPDILTFCERPTYIHGPRGPAIDFWVQLRGAPLGEFWIVESPSLSASASLSTSPGTSTSLPKVIDTPPLKRPSHLHDLPVRYLSRADLIAWEIPITNWTRLIPYLVSHRRYKDAVLEQQIMAFLKEGESLDAVVANFGERDEATVQAAVFQLLAQGRVISPDLAVRPLDGATRFQRVPVVPIRLSP